jgi:hypothetical protein
MTLPAGPLVVYESIEYDRLITQAGRPGVECWRDRGTVHRREWPKRSVS